MPVLQRWRTILNGCNLDEIERADWISRWLVITRACVISMTATSGMIGVLLAITVGGASWFPAVLCVLGIIFAHLSNNLINDWTDSRMGVDTEDYPRTQYSTHPILGGLTTLKGLLVGATVLTTADLAIMVYLASIRGSVIIWFAVGGLALSLLYTVLLKRIGLGELTALAVWGPLMTLGTIYAVSGEINSELLLASIPYGLIVAGVLVGKHMDKIDADRKAGLKTVPASIGVRRSVVVLKLQAILFYLLIALLSVLGVMGPWSVVTLLALPKLIEAWKRWSAPKPDEPPEGWPVWPLWYVGWAMSFNRRAGVLLVFAILLDVVLPLIFSGLE